jgi:hypothetical protein
MDTMNVGSSFSHTHVDQEIGKKEFDVDEDGEGLIGACQGGRTGNYTMTEDRLLCKTWLTIGMDPTTGTNQIRDLLDEDDRVLDANNTSGNMRTIHSLRSRWSVINADCQKWASVQAGVDEINPSGTNNMDMISCSIVCYSV